MTAGSTLPLRCALGHTRFPAYQTSTGAAWPRSASIVSGAAEQPQPPSRPAGPAPTSLTTPPALKHNRVQQKPPTDKSDNRRNKT